jgi:hypothetical protein
LGYLFASAARTFSRVASARAGSPSALSTCSAPVLEVRMTRVFLKLTTRLVTVGVRVWVWVWVRVRADDAPVAVGGAPVVEDLQQHVEDVGVRLLRVTVGVRG